MTRLIALLVLLSPAAFGQVSFTLTSEMVRTNSGSHWYIQGWVDNNVTYYDVTEAYTNFASALDYGTESQLVVDVGIHTPGTYQLFVGFATQNTNMLISANVGGEFATNRTLSSSARWTNFCTFEATNSFSNVTLTVTKLFPAGTAQAYWFAGAGIVTNYYGTVYDDSEWRFANFAPITTQTTNSISTGNFVPNSSFEFGLDAYGWISGRNGNHTNEVWLSNMTTNDAYDGAKAAVFKGGGLNGSRYRITSPPIVLRGDRTERNYTLSFYHKTLSAATSFTFEWTPVYVVANTWFTNASATVTVTTSGSWSRFSTNVWFKPVPNQLLLLRWSTGALTDATAFAIDAVQVEEGPAATVYAPADPIECNVTLGRNGGMLDIGEDRNVTLEFYNTYTNTQSTALHWTAYDWMNRLLGSGTNVYSVVSGYSAESLAISFTNNGVTRVFGWLTNSPFSRSECVFSVVPLPTTPSLDTNSLFGTHGITQKSFVESNAAWGLSWQRFMNPGSVVSWEDIEPTEGDFTWTLTDSKVAQATNLVIMFATVTTVNNFPAWAMTNGIPRLDVWSNFLYQAVSRYKDRIWYWEDINEPAGTWTAEEYAPILETTATAVKAADAGAFFAAFGGVGGSYYGSANRATWVSNVWDSLSAGAQAGIDAVAIHIYPDVLQSQIETVMQLGAHTGKPVWNTESGVWQWGNFKGDRCGGFRYLPAYADHLSEYQYRRSVWEQPAYMARNVLRSLGRGMQKFFYYLGHQSSYHWYNEDAQTLPYNYEDSLNSVGAAYLWAKHFIDYPVSVSAPTNTEANCMAFVYEHTNSAVLATWVLDLNYSNYVATVTNSGFAVYDLQGNLIQTNQATAWINHIPTYWFSSSLTATQLHNLFKYATIEAIADTNAPGISLDVTAHGTVDSRHSPLHFYWTAIDGWRNNSDETPVDVITRYRFGGGTWSDWSSERTATLESASGTSWIEVEAKDLEGNTSATLTGPVFSGQSASNSNIIKAPVRIKGRGKFK